MTRPCPSGPDAHIDEVGADWGNVELLQIKSADVWVRDYGPTFVLSVEP